MWIRGEFDSSSISLEAPLNVSYIINSFPVVEYGSSLSLTSVNGTDGGRYTCLALNEAGIDNATVELLVRPEILTNPDNIYAQVGENVSFECLADSFPRPQYHWERFNETLNEFYTISYESDRTLMIDEVEYEDNGRYRCVATASMISRSATSDEAVLTGKYMYVHVCLVC